MLMDYCRTKDMIKKCNFGVKYFFVSGLVYTKRILTEFLEDVHLKLVNVCKEMEVYFIDKRNIIGFIFLGMVCIYRNQEKSY